MNYTVVLRNLCVSNVQHWLHIRVSALLSPDSPEVVFECGNSNAVGLALRSLRKLLMSPKIVGEIVSRQKNVVLK